MKKKKLLIEIFRWLEYGKEKFALYSTTTKISCSEGRRRGKRTKELIISNLWEKGKSLKELGLL